MTVKSRNKIRALWRWVIGIVAVLWLVLLSISYIAIYAVNSFYFHDYRWPSIGEIDMLYIVVGLYLVLVAIIGRWNIW